MNADTIMFGLIAAGVLGWIGLAIAGYVNEKRRKRELYRQIEYGEVPVDYSAAIKEVATEQGASILLTGFENESRSKDLLDLRTKVARIRADGYDCAKEDEVQGGTFRQGIEDNPWPNGSGEAKQWARGYCQAYGAPPKEWMRRA